MERKTKNKLLFIGSLVFAGIALIFVMASIHSTSHSKGYLIAGFVFLIFGYVCIILRAKNAKKKK